MTGPRQRLLVIEDESKTAETLQLYLVAAGFEVERARDGRAGIAAARARPPHLVLLDLMLPGCDGWTVARALRADGDLPILMLTARTSEADRLQGLRLGADDYVTKPFSPREVVLRVRAILRRASARGGPHVETETEGGTSSRRLCAGELVVDLDGRAARLGAHELPLPPAELAVLTVLLKRPGRVFTRDELAHAAFGHDWDAFSRTIDAHVSRLRRKLAEAGDEGERIVTVFGVGYKLAAPTDAR